MILFCTTDSGIGGKEEAMVNYPKMLYMTDFKASQSLRIVTVVESYSGTAVLSMRTLVTYFY